MLIQSHGYQVAWLCADDLLGRGAGAVKLFGFVGAVPSDSLPTQKSARPSALPVAASNEGCVRGRRGPVLTIADGVGMELIGVA